jgi:hypothetical protein
MKTLKMIGLLAMVGFISVSNYANAQTPDMSSDKMKMKDDKVKMKMKDDKMKMKMDMMEMKSWPMASQMAVKDMMTKYGKPDEATPTMMAWNNKGPWAKTVVFKQEYQHNFPMPHTDLLQQWVGLKVPTDKLNDLAKLRPSVFARAESETSILTNQTVVPLCVPLNNGTLAMFLSRSTWITLVMVSLLRSSMPDNGGTPVRCSFGCEKELSSSLLLLSFLQEGKNNIKIKTNNNKMLLLTCEDKATEAL